MKKKYKGEAGGSQVGGGRRGQRGRRRNGSSVERQRLPHYWDPASAVK